MWKCVVVILSVLAIVVKGEDDWRIVDIAQGRLRGHKDPDGGVYNFYSIPYATAPTGRDRFKAPRPPPEWLSTFDAVNRNIACPQPTSFMNIQEDCLVANVFVPDTDQTNLPVLVIIHGGAYQMGHGLAAIYSDLVRTKELIVVSFNYRLGVHGFLCLGTEAAPGNAGIKDQIALLRWVNANIVSFGGNPEDVTLAACSAGSGSIDVLTLSSLTKGLFKKAIMESGVSTGATGVQIDPIENAKNYAKLLNFNDVDDLNRLEEFYTGATFQQLISRIDAITNNQDVTIMFAPCVERDIGLEAVITDAPMNIIKRGNYTKVPLLYGFTNKEGMMRLRFFDTWKDQMNERFSDFLPAELYFESDNIKEEVSQEVKQFYFGNQTVSSDTILAYVSLFTDLLFGYPMISSVTARIESLGDQIYLYEYSYADEDTPSIPYTDVRGASHCDCSRTVRDHDRSNKTEYYRQMSNLMRENWLHFVLTGTPLRNSSLLPEWPPTNARRTPHMCLGPVIELKNDILGNRAALWDPIYEKYYRGPVLNSGAISVTTSNVLMAVLLAFILAT